MKRLSAIVLLALATLASTSACAQDTDVIADLRAHRFEPIERYLAAADDAFQADRLSEGDLLDTYKVFYASQDVLSPDLQAWVRERPDSYIAHLASGTYHRKLGEMRRGTGFGSSVSDARNDQMLREFGLAKPELQRALALNPRSFLAIVNLQNIAQFTGDDALADKMVALGDAAYPANLLMRARHLVHLSPRWGGSLAAMDAFIAAERKNAAPEDVVANLNAVRCNEDAFGHEMAGDQAGAVALYQRCMGLVRNASAGFTQVYLMNSLRHCQWSGGGFVCR